LLCHSGWMALDYCNSTNSDKKWLGRGEHRLGRIQPKDDSEKIEFDKDSFKAKLVVFWLVNLCFHFSLHTLKIYRNLCEIDVHHCTCDGWCADFSCQMIFHNSNLVCH
jgi:fumarate reductase subunit D